MKHRIEIIKDEIARSAELSNGLIKWFVASLLLLNGSALITLMNVEKGAYEAITQFGWTFAVGLVCALLTGFVFSFASAITASKLIQFIWTEEEPNEDDFIKFLNKNGTDLGSSLILFILMTLSTGLFVFGCYDVATHGKSVFNDPKIEKTR